MCYDIEDIHDVRALAKGVREMTGLSDPQMLFSRLCQTTVELTDFTWALLGLVDHDHTIRPVSSFGDVLFEPDAVVRWGEGLGGSAVRVQDSHLLDGRRAVDNEDLRALGTAEEPSGAHLGTLEPFVPDNNVVVAHPVIHAGLVVAILYAGRPGPAPHQHDQLAMVSELAIFAAPLIISVIRATDLAVLAKAEERQRIVKHLHDTSLQLLFNISLTAQRLRRVDNPAEAFYLVESIATDARDASDCLRNTFRANLPAERSLVVAVRELSKAFSGRTMVPAEVTTLGAPRECPNEVDRVLLSATREVLHNIEKHAHAKSVMIGLAYGETDVTLMIQDDGVGFPPGYSSAPTTPGSGLGLPGVDQAAATVGGTVDWWSNEDGGVTMRVQVPIKGAA